MKRTWIVIATALWAGSAGAAYKCVDAKGITHIGDTPPPGCATVMMYEVTPTGKVIRAIEPTPTPEQAKALAAEAAKKREADAKAAEMKRRDVALLSTFGSEKEFDVARERNIEPIKARIGTAQDRMQAVDTRQKALEEEMEFYKSGKSKGKGKEAPATMTEELARLQKERAALQASITGYEKEIEQVRVKFDGDKKRWVELKGGGTPAKTADSAPPETKAPVKKN
jgi:hypothetical protein